MERQAADNISNINKKEHNKLKKYQGLKDEPEKM